MTRVFRDVLKYVHKNNEYGEGSLLNKSNFSTLFPFLYFDLTKQKMDIKDGTTKLTFKYELSGTTAAAYSIYALTLLHFYNFFVATLSCTFVSYKSIFLFMQGYSTALTKWLVLPKPINTDTKGAI